MAPTDVSIYATRVFMKRAAPSDLLRMAENVERASSELASANVDVIVYGCTSGSLINGAAWERELKKRIEEASGLPAVTTAGAVIDALNHLDTTTISVATPYSEQLNKMEKAFLESQGLCVETISGLNIVDAFDIGKEPPETAYRMARSVDSSKTQAVFISCTNFRTFEIIQRLEKDLSKPVVTSNQASLWASMRLLDLTEPIDELGKLFSK